DIAHDVHEGANAFTVVLKLAMSESAFIARYATEAKHWAGLGPLRDGECMLARSAPCTLIRRTDLKQTVERHRGLAACRPGFNAVDLRHRIDQKPDGQVFMARQYCGERIQICTRQHLIGNDDAPRTGPHPCLYLKNRGERQTPRAGSELTAKNLRRHCGF